MDPVSVAKKLIDSLVEEELEKLEEAKNNEEEDEGEEDEGEEGDEQEDEGEEDKAPAQSNKPKAQSQQGGATQNQGTVAMKPASFGGASGKGDNKLAHDAHGGGVSDAHGGGEQLGTMQYTDNSAQNRASIAMKPSFATGGGVSAMSEEQVRKDIQTIFGGEELSEEFVSQAGSIYEAAVMAKAEEVIQEIHEQYESAFEQQVEDITQELNEKVDQYLNYVVEEWMKENRLAIENGLRTEIAENFIAKMKDLFVESYIEVPQNKINLFDEMAETISELEEKVNRELERNVTLVNENKAVRAVAIFREETSRLADSQVDKIAKLAENLEFESDQDFRNKIRVIVENTTKVAPISEKKTEKSNNNKYLIETVIEDETSGAEVSQDPRIRIYSEILSRTLQK